MSDRLAELRRQRALLQDHLAWLDREIAAETAAAQPITKIVEPSPPAAVVAPPAAARADFPATVQPNAGTDVLLDEYRVAPEALKRDIRKGCFLYFAAALVLLAVMVFGLYFALRRP